MMKYFKHTTILLFALCLLFPLQAQYRLPEHIQLSDSSDIVLLTCDPGDQLYSTFGHTAIGVYDYKSHLQFVFNYGTFSFNTPNFYLKFAGGKLNYKLSVSSYSRFLNEYKHEGRMVVEEQLNISVTQKQKMLDALLLNYLPENREYQYDFFFDNCATRILKIFEETLGDSLHYMAPDLVEQQTFRNLIDECLVNNLWSDFGIDIALGSVIDQVASEKQKAFLPHYLSGYCNNCLIGTEPLIGKTRILLPDATNYQKTPFLISPQFIFWLIFFVILAATLVFRKASWIITDRIIFSTIGLIGLIVLLLMFATDHDATAGNLNFLWANPLYLVYTLFINDKKYKYFKWATLMFLILSIFVLGGWNIIPQTFNIVFIPIIGILIVRLSVRFLRNR